MSAVALFFALCGTRACAGHHMRLSAQSHVAKHLPKCIALFLPSRLPCCHLPLLLCFPPNSSPGLVSCRVMSRRLVQRCICQESEVLARIGLRSLGRFVTTMHKSFPDASDTISRPKATTPRGEGGGSAGSSPEDADVSHCCRCCRRCCCCCEC